MTFPFGEPVDVHRVSGRSRDGDGNTVREFEDQTYTRTSVASRFSQEFDDGSRDTALVGYSVTFRPAIALASADEMTVRGRRCAIDGEPLQYNNPFTGATQTRAVLKFVKG